ncbi:heat-inducible transcriptional repressor HrcA [bacterium]|nr:heat-inducible transcriptional repressor HrcA [bacterium]
MTRFAAPLSERQTQILLAIVREHVQTREPVGSQVVRETYGVQASTATIRNEMVELEHAGYLYQPHTSAGRVPCDSAYRVYVNYLTTSEAPEPQTAGWIEGEYRRLGREPHELLRQTSRLLARLTSHPAVATLPPVEEPTLQRIGLQPVSATNVLLTYATSDGQERHHLLGTGEPVTAAQLTALSEALDRVLTGRRVSLLSQLSLQALRPYLKDQVVPESLLTAIAQAAATDDSTEVYVEGTSYILDEPEFGERERLRAFMRTLDEHSSLRRVLQAAVDSPSMTVTIGREHQVEAMAECSLVASPYPYGRAHGVVGIFGPTRMDYRRAMGAVAFVARKLSEALSQLGR